MRYIVRLAGDIGTKSPPVRRRFVKTLKANLKRSARKLDIPFSLTADWNKILIENTHSDIERILSSTFGISSYSPIDGCTKGDMTEILDLGEELYSERVAGKRFAVQTRRTGQHDFRSVDVNVNLGSRLLMKNLDLGTKVDLRNPQVTVSVQIQEDCSYFYSTIIPGSNGLPTGVGGNGVCLFSGGIDSPVAHFMMSRRGMKLQALFCNMGGEDSERAVVEVAQHMRSTWHSCFPASLHVVDMQGIITEILAKVKPAYAQVVLKRCFYRLAQALAQDTHGLAIVTGEALNQVSSQTLENLKAISEDATLPILRPLISFDKNQIVEKAKRIGTFASSSKVLEHCQLVRNKPVTACTAKRLFEEFKNIDEQLLFQAYVERRVLDLDTVTSKSLQSKTLYTNELSEGFEVLDLRDRNAFSKWHVPGAVNWEFHTLLKEFPNLAKDKKYILCCPLGFQSLIIAEKLQRSGVCAYSLRGGTRELIKRSQATHPPKLEMS